MFVLVINVRGRSELTWLAGMWPRAEFKGLLRRFSALIASWIGGENSRLFGASPMKHFMSPFFLSATIF